MTQPALINRRLAIDIENTDSKIHHYKELWYSVEPEDVKDKRYYRLFLHDPELVDSNINSVVTSYGMYDSDTDAVSDVLELQDRTIIFIHSL